jgi:hypothetical protein
MEYTFIERTYWLVSEVVVNEETNELYLFMAL